MAIDYEKWEKETERIRKENEALLEEFEFWLSKSGVGDKTINRHIGNVDFYINNYLLYSDIVEAKDGALDIGGFLGDWFIRKVTWSSRANIKASAASFKKFYTFLLERGDISKEELKELKALIKEEMPDWLDNVDDDGW
ncbi:MAG: recombinase [Saprospiraceae bacterium]